MTARGVVVDGQVPEREAAQRAACGRVAALLSQLVTHGGFDPGGELGRGERFDDVVGGAHLECLRDDVVSAVGGQEDDRGVADGQDVLHQLDPVGAWQHQIEQHHMGVDLLDQRGHLLGVSGHGRLVALVGERVADALERARGRRRSRGP